MLTPPVLKQALKEVQEKANRLIIHRGFHGILIIIAAIVLSWLWDWWLGKEIPHFRLVSLVSTAHIGLMLAFLWLHFSPKSEPYAIPIQLLVQITVCVMTVVTEILKRDVTTAPLFFIPLVMFGSTLLPWGVRAQCTIVATAAVALMGNAYAVRENLPPAFGYVAVAAAIAFGTSIYIAYEINRHRVTSAAQSRAATE